MAVAFRASSALTGSTTTTAAFTIPTGTTATDLAVVGLYIETTAAITKPDGTWAEATGSPLTLNEGAGSGRLRIFYSATPATAGSWTFSWTGSAYRSGSAASFSGRTGTGYPFGTQGTVENNSNSFTLPSITIPTTGDGVVAVATENAGKDFTVSGGILTERQDNDEAWIGSKDSATAGASGTQVVNSSATGDNHAWWAAILQDSGGGATPTRSARLVNPRRRPARVGRLQRPQQGTASGPQSYTSPQAATVGFTGADATLTSKGLTAAAVGFTGSLTKRLTRALTATVSFTGALATAAVHNFTQALTATLSFTGTQTRRAGKAIAATVSFTGAQARATAVGKSATVSFTGAQTRRVGRTLTAAVSFTGAQTRRVGHGMTAAVSFTGSLVTAAVHFFTQTFTATVGFTGSLATQAVHVFTKALTATVGFTGSVTRRTARSVAATLGLTAGSLTRRIGSGQSATLGFTGSIRRAIGHRLSAAVGFVGNLVGLGSAVHARANPLRLGIVPAENRRPSVRAEDRTESVPAEDRIPSVLAEDRHPAVPRETRR